MPPVFLSLLALLFSAYPLFAASVVLGPPEPILPIEYVPAGGPSEGAIAVANGDRMLVIWNRGEGAVRLDEEGRPLDVPAIRLPKPAWTSGADLVADGDGWIVGWTVFTLSGSPSKLRLARVTREGDVTDTREILVPAIVEQNMALHLANRNGVLVAAYQMPYGSDFGVAVVTESALFKVNGELRELAATSDGYALILRDRVVRLATDGAPMSEIALPSDFIANDVTVVNDDLVLGGGSWTTGTVVVRVRAGSSEAEVVARIPTLGANARVAANGEEIIVIWTAAKEKASHPYSSTAWDLFAARIRADGSILEGPQRLRESVDISGRWVIGPDLPLVERVGDGWVAVWSEGMRAPSVVWRNLYSANLSGSLTAIAAPRPVTFRASDQWLVGTTISNDVVLTVWTDNDDPFTVDPVRVARRTGLDGRIIDVEPIRLGTIQPLAVRATDTGFVILAADRHVRLGVSGPPVHDTAPPLLRDVTCTPDGCIAVWIEVETPGERSSLRYASWREGILGTPTTIHTSDVPYRDLALASDDGGALLAFGRVGTPGGTILAAARIEHSSGGWTHTLSDFAAGPTDFRGLQLARRSDRYVAIWFDPALGRRGSHLTLDGHSLDGDETGWAGWPLIVEGDITDVAFDGKRTLLLASWLPPGNAIYELLGRTAIRVGQIESQVAWLDCVNGGCVIAYTTDVEGDPWYRATRVFLQRFWFGRPRAVRH